MKSKIPADAFDFYLSLGASRGYQAVADKYGVSKTAIVKRAERERWQERLERVEREAQQRSDQRAIETLDSMNQRHLKTMQVIQAKALEALKSMHIDSAINAVRALDLAIRQERLIRGEPSERTAVSVEDVIRREYERWLADDADDYASDSPEDEEEHDGSPLAKVERPTVEPDDEGGTSA